MDKYVYYMRIEHEEHMLYANEIAKMYGMFKNNNPNHPDSAKVVNIMKKYAKSHDIEIKDIYYHTKYGLKKVYPEILYRTAIEEYKSN